MAKKNQKNQSESIWSNTYSLKVVVLAFVVGYILSAVVAHYLNKGEVKQTPKVAAQSAPMPATNMASPLAALISFTETHPQSPDGWIQLGNFYFDSSQSQKSIDAYEKALALDPNNPSVLVDCGVMYRNINNPNKAIELFDEALKLEPGHQTAMFNMGVVYYFDLKDTAKAKEVWKKVLEMNPNAKGPNGASLKEFVDTL